MFKKFAPHLVVIVGFFVLACMYASPILSGKTVAMNDVNQAAAAGKEVQDFYKQTGEWAWWTNSMFGGMPSFMIAGGYPNSWSSVLGATLNDILPSVIGPLFLMMLGFYLLTRALKTDYWIGALGSIAYAFGSYNLLYLEAGHVSKILALAYAPAMIAGIIWVFQRKYLVGGAIMALFFALELYANHLQITYYLAFIIGIYVLFQSYVYVKHSDFGHLLKSYGILAVAGLIALGTHTMRLWNNYEYSKETIRGKSELAMGNVVADGLEKDYAFSYSYGVDESLTLLVPNFRGGGSVGSLDQNSATYKAMVNAQVDPEMAKQFVAQLPLYFGSMNPGTSGPAYSGAIICFLFLLGLFVIKDRFKWVLLAMVVFFTMLSWGGNFTPLSYFMFDHFPMYNKFRVVSMILTFVHLLLIWGAVLCLKEIIDTKISFVSLKKPLLITFGILALVMFMGYFASNYGSENDASFKQNISQALGAEQGTIITNSLISDRSSMVWSDTLRSLVFILLAGATLWLFTNNKVKQVIFSAVMIALVALDLIIVDKRYFNNSDFKSKSEAAASFVPTTANEQILADKDPNFRVVNIATDFWADAKDSYFHKSIGGYHGAKLKRMNELHTHQMIKNGSLNLAIMNMLNTKYFITAGKDNALMAQQNPGALGNAWFVGSVKTVKNADEEMKSMDAFNPKQVAFVDQRYGEFMKGNLSQDTTATIKLTDYKPNQLIYESDSKTNQVVVFSEVYYRGNEDWKSFVDGKETPHFRANYVLRAMVLPSGKHQVTFKFAPRSVEIGNKIDLFASIAMVLFIGGAVFFEWKKNSQKA